MPTDFLASPLVTLAIALGIGALVGLQRQREGPQFAGLRTFALLGLVGGLSGLVAVAAGDAGALVIAGGAIAVAWICAIANRLMSDAGEPDPGMTTEVAALAVYFAGVLIAFSMRIEGVAAGVAIAALLHGKQRLHSIAAKITEKDFRSILTFAIISLVVLPVLPTDPIGPYDVIVPRNVWLMVVLVVGMSLAAYIAHRVLGERGGGVLAGLLGGMISSTATTAAVARQARDRAAAGAVAILLLATCAMYIRVMVEIAVAAPSHAAVLIPPVAALFVVNAALAATMLLRKEGREGASLGEPESPTNLGAAIIFALVYALVLVAVAWMHDTLGGKGTYITAAISGLTDMDAITLSTARLAESGSLPPGEAWRAMLIAAVANMVCKAGIAWSLGGSRLAARLGACFGICAAAAVAIMVFWPAPRA